MSGSRSDESIIQNYMARMRADTDRMARARDMRADMDRMARANAVLGEAGAPAPPLRAAWDPEYVRPNGPLVGCPCSLCQDMRRPWDAPSAYSSPRREAIRWWEEINVPPTESYPTPEPVNPGPVDPRPVDLEPEDRPYRRYNVRWHWRSARHTGATSSHTVRQAGDLNLDAIRGMIARRYGRRTGDRADVMIVSVTEVA